jgi:uncharacterized protein YkwD
MALGRSLSACTLRTGWRFYTMAMALVFVLVSAAHTLAGYDAEQMIKRIVHETNTFRQSEGKKPLTGNARLSKAAQKHAEHMARAEKISHEGFSKFIEEVGYDFSHIAENVAYFSGPVSAEAVMNGWKTSSPHRKNLLDPQVSEIGVGAAQDKSGHWYFCLDLGHPNR